MLKPPAKGKLERGSSGGILFCYSLDLGLLLCWGSPCPWPWERQCCKERALPEPWNATVGRKCQQSRLVQHGLVSEHCLLVVVRKGVSLSSTLMIWCLISSLSSHWSCLQIQLHVEWECQHMKGGLGDRHTHSLQPDHTHMPGHRAHRWH